MLPLNGGLFGLKEKRLTVSNGLALTDAATHGSDTWNRSADNTLLLDDETTPHVNHANDPGTSTLTLTDDAGFNFVRLRGLSDDLALSDHVHVSKDGLTETTSQHTLTANETINVGQPVYVSSADTVNLADADTLNTSHVLGLAVTDATANSNVIVMADGSVERSDWTAITGTASLTPGVVYYLSTTAGGLTSTPPTGDGDNIVRCGVAVSTTKFDIEINEVAIL